MFDDFSAETVDAGRLRFFVRHCGEGPAVLLLHGHPRTSATWHLVAPRLVEQGFTVVCADLPGYGRSGKKQQRLRLGRARSSRTGRRPDAVMGR
ncbi:MULTISPECIES: alpha/beta fold hydrolase [Brevibacterium]|uniref:alpha/beta fold hydrolase n=1 Tax=Brevibacterium TaxID=1696 RepID=UPI001C68FF59